MKIKQLGISMIELLVAMLISSFLILGVTQVYIDNRSNTLFQQNQAGNIENARFSVLILEQELAKAGYRRSADHSMEYAFPAENAAGRCGVMEAGQVVGARVVKIDRDERRLGLSIKAANYSAEELAAETATYEALNRNAGNDMMNLGDILDAASDKKE